MISSPKATKSRAAHPFTTNFVLFSKNIHNKGQKGQKQVTNGIFSCLCPFQTMSPRFRPRRRQITGRRPVHYELRFFPPKIYIKRSKRSKKGHKLHFFMFLPVSDYVSKISSPKVTKSRAVGLSTMNDGPKARLYRFRRRRRPSTGRRPVHRCRRCKYVH